MSQPPRKEVLVAAIQDVRPLASILRGVALTPDPATERKGGPRAMIDISEAGLMVTVEYKRTLLASAYLYAQMFNEYTYNKPDAVEGQGEEDDHVLEIKLGLFLSALDVFGGAGMGIVPLADSDKGGKGRGRRDEWDADRVDPDEKKKSTAMRLTWLGEGHRLNVHLSDSPNVSTVCELSTFQPEPMIDLPFNSEEMLAKIIMRSSWLREALSEVDPKSQKITFICTPPAAQGTGRKRKPTFRLRVSGNWETSTMNYPDEKEVLEVAEFGIEEPISFTYRFENIAKSMHALRSSLKTSLRIDSEGILSLQFMIPFRRPKVGRNDGPSPSENFIEFRCAALLDDA